MLLEQLCSLLGRRHFPDPVGEVSPMIEDLEEGFFVGSFERFAVSQDGESVAAMTNDKVSLEAAVDLPAGASETLFCLFGDHLLAPILSGSVQISQRLLKTIMGP